MFAAVPDMVICGLRTRLTARSRTCCAAVVRHCHSQSSVRPGRVSLQVAVERRSHTGLSSSYATHRVRRLTGTPSKSGPQSQPTVTENTTWLQRFLGPKPMPPRHTLAWYKEVFLICTVFAITGSSTMMLVRPAVRDGLGLQGSMKDGPWSYRICSLIVMSPIYGVLLVCVGTLFGRHTYFRYFSVKIFSRFGIPPELLDKKFHETSKNFKRW